VKKLLMPKARAKAVQAEEAACAKALGQENILGMFPN
jgi:hypothetical protein